MSALVDALLVQIRACGLPEPEREVAFWPGRRFRFDLAWPALKLAAEVDGGQWVRGRHNRPQGYERDAEKLNGATVQGWAVLRFTGAMVADGRAVAWLEKMIDKRRAA